MVVGDQNANRLHEVERLLSPALDRRSAKTERLLARWGMLHAVRSALSGAALLLFFYLVIFMKSA
jgi:Domain of unknown function (DUF1772)